MAALWQSLRTHWAKTDTADDHPRDRGNGSSEGRAPRGRRRQPVLLEERRSRWRLRRRNPISAAAWMTAIAATVPLLLGILLTWADANVTNPIVSTVLQVGGWLSTPFHAMFILGNPDHEMMLNWGIAAGTYLIGGRILAWMLRW
jgi:hypothetical protein